MYCWKCGKKIRVDSVFCSNCGIAITEEEISFDNSRQDNTLSESPAAKTADAAELCRPESPQYNIISESPAAKTADAAESGQPEPLRESSYDTAEQKADKPRKKRGVKKIILFVTLCAAAAAALILVPVFSENARADRYRQAAALMTSDPLKAKDEFNALGDYKDSAVNAGLCQNIYDYNAAADMINAKNYEGAIEAFRQLGDYEDSKSKVLECQHLKVYADAEAFFSEGKYYSAYVLFKSLENVYSDCTERAQDCIRPYPETSRQTESNFTYEGPEVSFTIKAPDDGYYTYIKIYIKGAPMPQGNGLYSDDCLVYTVFIAPGDSFRMKLPTFDTFTFKQAYGTAWFGREEAFGDGGYYSVIRFKGKDGAYSNELTTEWEYSYTMSLRQSKGNTEEYIINREDF